MSKLFWAMLSFISRLPVPARWSQGLDFEHYSRGIVMFPLIGVVLGGLTGLVFMALQPWCGVPLAATSLSVKSPGVKPASRWDSRRSWLPCFFLACAAWRRWLLR